MSLPGNSAALGGTTEGERKEMIQGTRSEPILSRPDLDSATREALQYARYLAENGVPLFLAKPLPGEDEWALPNGWQHTTPDPSVVDDWEPGMALCAVTGCALDVVDVDPRNGGDLAALDGVMPTVYGVAETPSGGTHHFIAPLGERKFNVPPGIDVLAGDSQGEGRSFVFLAPTVRASKVDGVSRAYAWRQPPDLGPLLIAEDTSGAALAAMKPAKQATTSAEYAGPAYADLTPEQQREADAEVSRVAAWWREHLQGVEDWPEGQRDDKGRGWEALVRDLAYAIAGLVAAPWTNLDEDQGQLLYDELLPAALAENDDCKGKWRAGLVSKARVSDPPWVKRSAPQDDFSALEEDPVALERNSGGQIRMAYRLARAYGGKLLHVHGIGWHAWDGSRWKRDERGRAQKAVRRVLDRAWSEAMNDKTLQSDVKKCQSDAGVRGVLAQASTMHPFDAVVDDMDADPYLLNVANGTVDLRTMELKPHDPGDRITKIARGAYDTSAPGRTWGAFLERVLPDAEVREFLQRHSGLALCGKVLEHVLAILIGAKGRNGKSTFYEALAWALGDYAASAEPNLFMHRDGAHPAGEMDLLGRRWVVVSESNRGQQLAEATVKRLTGGDTIKARYMRQDFVQFAPSHTAVLVTNHLPKVAGGGDPALWARMRVIPFEVRIPDDEQDSHLGEKLEVEADAVLAWALDGWRDYRARGSLAAPDAVRVATSEYQQDEDAFGRFLVERTLDDPGGFAIAGELYEAWVEWSSREPDAPLMTSTAFGRELSARGYESGGDVRVPGKGKAKVRKGLKLTISDAM